MKLLNPETEWRLKPNIQAAFVRYLETHDWLVERQNDVRGESHQPDVVAVQGGRTVWFIVKGLPWTHRPPHTWPGDYAEREGAELAVVVPDEPHFRSAIVRVKPLMERLGCSEFYFVKQDGSVEIV